MVNMQSRIDELQREYNSNYEKIERLEEEYKDISKIKKNKNRKEAELRNDIAVHQLMVRNQIIQECIKSLKDKQIQTNLLEVSDDTKKLEMQIGCIEERLIEQYKKLDNLSIQETLHWYSRDKILSKLEICLSSVGTGLSSTLVIGLGISSMVLPIPLLYGIGISFVFSSGIAGVVFANRNRAYKNILQKCHHEYKQSNVRGETTLNQMIETIIKSSLELQNKKSVLENKGREEQKRAALSQDEMIREISIDSKQVLESELVESDFMHKTK